MAISKSARHSKKQMIVPLIVFSVLPIWFGIVLTPNLMYGIQGLFFSQINIFDFRFFGLATIKNVALFLFVYAFAAFFYISTRKNTRRDEEYGGLHWGDPAYLTKKYADKRPVIVTREEAERKHLKIIATVERAKLFTWDIIVFAVLLLGASIALGILLADSLDVSPVLLVLLFVLVAGVIFALRIGIKVLNQRRKEKMYLELSDKN